MEASSNQKQSIGGSSYDGKIAGLYDLEETLGSGHFAVVKLARHVFTGAKVAVKVVDKTKLDEVSKAHLFQEVRCMKLVQHPNVVRLYEVIDTQTKLYLVLELGDGGDLYDYIMKHEGGLTEDLARKYFKQILRAISYCHQLHVVHRDLKPENVVFFEKLGVVKLTDFGFSNKFSPGQKLETFCGSLAYSAPEILLGDSYDAPAVDIWSLGVILYMLVCGQPPFEKANDSETLTMIMDCKYTVPPQISKNCRQLIASMLVRDPKNRATLELIASHPWIRENAEADIGEHLPLVSRQELSEEDHAFILQKMINGNIAAKEDILQSLDKNKYNYISATYFLLAEIRLRKRREEHCQRRRAEELKAGGNSKSLMSKTNAPHSAKKVIAPISINVVPPTPCIAETTKEKRSRKCSIVREEDEDESLNDSSCESNELKVALTRRESISDGRLNKSVHERANKIIPSSALPLQDRSKRINSPEAVSVDNLFESEDLRDSSGKDISEETLKRLKELEIGKLNPLPSGSKNPVLTHRRSKLHKIRTPSCSSSEASDDDTKAKNKKKMNKLVGDTPNRLRMHRRDSHDDSSDSQDHPSSGARVNTQRLLTATNTSSVENKKEGQTQAKDQSKHSQPKGKKNCKDSTNKRLADGCKHSSHHRRRRIRESQSLDRITEAQEYEIRNRASNAEVISEQSNSLANLLALSVEQHNDEYDQKSIESDNNNLMKSSSAHGDDNVQSLFNDINMKNIYNINVSHNVISEGTSISKAIQVTGTKCFVTIKKIRRLGKYFPVVNFS